VCRRSAADLLPLICYHGLSLSPKPPSPGCCAPDGFQGARPARARMNQWLRSSRAPHSGIAVAEHNPKAVSSSIHPAACARQPKRRPKRDGSHADGADQGTGAGELVERGDASSYAARPMDRPGMLVHWLLVLMPSAATAANQCKPRRSMMSPSLRDEPFSNAVAIARAVFTES
jgi:hypothetical protein